ncbi:hypothetical protein LJC33_01870 [Eubacteriales bacterium OttesenSCG-928-N13]|nr:hypothetical protein [Eubacteriales bacterium OttesenSCG-928-N13]
MTSIDVGQGFYDNAMDVHGAMYKMITDDSVRAKYMRAYMNFRFLFWSHVYFSDANANNNPTFGQLLFDGEPGKNTIPPFLPRDYEELIMAGNLKIAVRSNLWGSNGIFSQLRACQVGESSHVQLPTIQYTERLDEIVEAHPDSLAQFDIAAVGNQFTRRTREYLSNVTSYDIPTVAKAKEELRRLSLKQDTILFRDLRASLEHLGYPKGSDEYEQIDHDVGKIYSTTIPLYLGLPVEDLQDKQLYSSIIDRSNLQGRSVELRCSFAYAFDIDFLAYAPSADIVTAVKTREHGDFVDAFRKLSNTLDDSALNRFQLALEAYVHELDKIFKDSYLDVEHKSLLIANAEREKRGYLFLKAWNSGVARCLRVGIPIVYGHIFSGSLSHQIGSDIVALAQGLIEQNIILNLDKPQEMQDRAEKYAQLAEMSVIHTVND